MRQERFPLDPDSSLAVSKIAAILHQGLLWMVFGTSYVNSVNVGCMNQANFKAAVPQTIPVKELGAFHFFSTGDNLYLVIGKQQQGSMIYKLERKNNFDQMEDVRLRTRHVKAITGFVDGNAYYLIFGMTSEEGSQVYKFDILTETVQLVQEVQDRQVQGAHQFIDLHDNQRYLALLNTNAQLRLYLWNRDQLQEWQTLKSPQIGPSTSLAIVGLSNLENILCLAHKGNLYFYSDDLTGHYIVNFVARTKCINVYSLQALRMGQEYVIAYLCDEATGSLSLQGRRLLLSERLEVQRVTRTEELLACLQDVSTGLDARRNDITILDNYLNKLPPKPDDGSQRWQGPITFARGLTVTGTTTFEETLTLQPPQEVLLTPESLPLVSTRLEALQESVQVLQNNSNYVLYYSEDQSFPGPINAPALRVDAAHFGTLKIGKLNGLDIANLEQIVLLNGVDQHINAPLVLPSLRAYRFTTHTAQATLNGIRTSDLMRKNAQHQVVSGEHMYTKLRVVGNILPLPSADREFTINDVPVSTIVTKGSSVTFLAHKTIKKLVVMSTVDVRLVNGVSLRSVGDQVVYTDMAQPQILSGAVKLTSVEVAGDVDVVLINGVNLRQLNANTVKVTGNFALQGDVAP
ncbi:uncharacterized protein LOC126988153 isoform X5 [Eriocheir sinensis]|uniref:uncharacterized protein LOC126988153 isoform X5 n=1 Tax=Eriocheir sinensis TaxID=95602 RepID=UPI0021C58E1C|nr:uncharacterized protein LOC126988153 isoform X5 [Eriocheir sinensis]XP_050702201.1 uncharacterized protein LOC126988153 isoform X5 [Eriocheir sinensis]